MKSKWQIILSGVGGQGLIACGSLMAQAAILHENKFATLSSSYGVETRGTFSKSDIIISDDEIHYPEVMKEDLILTLAQVAYDRYVSTMDRDAYLVYDTSIISKINETKSKQIGFPFTKIARELGNTAVANIVALGVIVKHTNILKEESVKDAIKEIFKSNPKVADLNVKAFNTGIILMKSNG